MMTVVERPQRTEARPRFSLGHASRLGLTLRMKLLIAAHVVIFIASQVVDEFVEWLALEIGLLPAQAAVLEVTIGLVLFLLWTACMLGWVRQGDTK
ncbi:MAG: hypothetical protein ACE37J_10415 [Pikeienuella sp.]|uniref:hypothetical protein n=1 Tax=Pikeienuella sp. TaxID=2831957 RepID=UPI003919D3F3